MSVPGTIVRLVPAVLSAWLVGAHFLRFGQLGLALSCLLFSLLFFFRQAWIAAVSQILLAAGALLWIWTAVRIADARVSMGLPWGRMVLILGAVAVFTAGSALLFRSKTLRNTFSRGMEARRLCTVTFFLTAILLTVIQLKAPLPILLLERFLPGGGWLEVLLLPSYAAWIVGKMKDPRRAPKWRRWIWLAFSLVIFGQLFLGAMGFDRFLMTGELHPPVPAVIAAGPLFRGEGLFMPILFGATLLLIGPAWCSHLCYIGSWDHSASLSRKRPLPLPRWTPWLRAAILCLVLGTALLLRGLGASGIAAAALALLFGLSGVLVMILVSRRMGAMVHCTVVCPMGLIANLIGKLSPFRIRIQEGCTDCGACTTACRYDALNAEHITRRKPGLYCTLCGDCLNRCKEGQIEYRFPGLRGSDARSLFLALTISLHAVFLGVAML